jgi:hypothetical protein
MFFSESSWVKQASELEMGQEGLYNPQQNIADLVCIFKTEGIKS